MTPRRERPPTTAAVPGDVQVRLELERILASSVFRGSKRCQSFLSFVVSRTLDGDADSLKERTLATEVFGRSVGADLTDDSIVRVGAREVRKRLALYYETEGVSDSLRIELPPGSYVPSFQPHMQEPLAPEAAPVVAAISEVPPAAPAEDCAPVPARPRVPIWVPAASLILLGAAPLLVWQWSHRVAPEFRSFWRPVFDERGAPLLVLSERLNGSDFVPAMDQYAGFGDTVAAVRLAGLFSIHSRPARVRLASNVDSAAMRDTATVLIGAFNNRWTVRITQKFRFRFLFEDARQPAIVDTAAAVRRWALEKSGNERSNEDYILVCRVPHSESGGFIIVGAGLTQPGTQEVGRILAEPDVLAPLLRKLPGDWPSKNVELVLRARIGDDIPASPELIASHLW